MCAEGENGSACVRECGSAGVRAHPVPMPPCLLRRTADPIDITAAGARVRKSGKREQQVREAVQIDYDVRREVGFAGEGYDAALAAAADGARVVEVCGRRGAAGEDEVPQR